MRDNGNKRARLFSIRYLFYDFVKVTAIPGYLWFRPKRIYANPEAKKKIKGGALVISNHVGFSDPVVIMLAIWYRRHHFICIKDFFEGRLRLLFKGFHCIPIDKENFGMDSFRIITEHLKNGEVVSMFPEGHVNIDADNGLDQFKSGMVLMSVMSGKPIVPVYIHKREHIYNRTKIAIGEPVDIVALHGARPSMTQIEETAAMLRERELELEKLITGGKKNAFTK